MKLVTLPSGDRVASLGQGTWHMGERPARRTDEIAALRYGLDRGLSLIDTAEMYGEGACEELVAEAIGTRRHEVFIVSKVYPHNSSQRGMVEACERSLRRLKTDRIDLYLLHWRSTEIPFNEPLKAFQRLTAAGKIRHWGVSNLDLNDLRELTSLAGGDSLVTNQVLYNLGSRGIEWDLLPWLRARRIPVMAYSPLYEGRLIRDAKLATFASAHGLTPAQAALSWLLTNDDIIVIPMTCSRKHLDENITALDHRLTDMQLAELDRLFPPPTQQTPLEMI